MKRIIAVIIAVMTLMTLCVPMGAGADADPNIYIGVSPASPAPGDTVEVTINIEDNPGVAGTTLWIEFDPDALLIGDPDDWEDWISEANGIGLDLLAANANTSGRIGFVFGQAGNAVADGVLATIEFTVAQNAVPGDYEIELDVVNLANAARMHVPFTSTDGAFTVSASAGIVYGDASGDGLIDLDDIITIAQYILDNSVQIAQGADVTDDNLVDLDDIITIAQYILDNSVVLGPQA